MRTMQIITLFKIRSYKVLLSIALIFTVGSIHAQLDGFIKKIHLNDASTYFIYDTEVGDNNGVPYFISVGTCVYNSQNRALLIRYDENNDVEFAKIYTEDYSVGSTPHPVCKAFTNCKIIQNELNQDYLSIDADGVLLHNYILDIFGEPLQETHTTSIYNRLNVFESMPSKIYSTKYGFEDKLKSTSFPYTGGFAGFVVQDRLTIQDCSQLPGGFSETYFEMTNQSTGLPLFGRNETTFIELANEPYLCVFGYDVPPPYTGSSIGKIQIAQLTNGVPEVDIISYELDLDNVTDEVIQDVIQLGESNGKINLLALVRIYGIAESINPLDQYSNEVTHNEETGYVFVELEFDTATSSIIQIGSTRWFPSDAFQALVINNIDLDLDGSINIYGGSSLMINGEPEVTGGLIASPRTFIGSLDWTSQTFSQKRIVPSGVASKAIFDGNTYFDYSFKDDLVRYLWKSDGECVTNLQDIILEDIPTTTNLSEIDNIILQEIESVQSVTSESEYVTSEFTMGILCASSSCILPPATYPIVSSSTAICGTEELELSISGSAPPYETITWSTEEDNVNSILISEPGVYGATILDANGCVTETEITIGQITAAPEYIIEEERPLCSSISGQLTATFIEPQSNWSLYWDDTSDSSIETYSYVSHSLNAFDQETGCIMENIESAQVTPLGPSIEIPWLYAHDVATGCSEEFLSADLSLQLIPNEANDYNANWVNQDASVIIPNQGFEGYVPPGIYTLVVSNEDESCQVEVTTREVQFPALELQLIPLTDNQCSYKALAIITYRIGAYNTFSSQSDLSLSSSTDLFQVNDVTYAFFENLESDLYSLHVTSDLYGCEAELNDINIGNPPIEITSVNVTNGCNLSSGTISLEAAGGYGNLNTVWDYDEDGEFDDGAGLSISNLNMGVYTVKVSDDNNCEVLATYEVEAATIGLIIEQNACQLTAIGQEEVDGQLSPSQDFSYFWFEGNIPNPNPNENVVHTGVLFEPANSGTYTVLGIHSTGCETVSHITYNYTAPQRTYNVCFNWGKTPTSTPPPPPPPPPVPTPIWSNGVDCANQLTANVTQQIKEICLNREAINDRTKVKFDLHQEHFTLFYYDRAGHLTKTIPPSGVRPDPMQDLSFSELGIRDNFPSHILPTIYEYNSLGQIISQDSPDVGVVGQDQSSRFLYDINQRLRFGQNPVQQTDGRISYTKYDPLGRMIESGECSLNDLDWSQLSQPQIIDNLDFPQDETYEKQLKNIVIYSDKAEGISYLGRLQKNLRNRISYTSQTTSIDDGEYTASTFYSYDVHGNVEWMIKDLPEVGKSHLCYEYDLISGNVLKVKYNEKRTDQFFHRYSYDANSRIVSAETSSDNILWDSDARYDYYIHGPLKRLELGEDKLQGLDYVYTLNGWLKSINHPNLQLSNLDPGNDEVNSEADVFGMSLGYFSGDYVGQINGEANPFDGYNNYLSGNLYNGNISSWSVAVRKSMDNLIEGDPTLGGNYNDPQLALITGNQFKYDRLNRIKSASSQWNSDLSDYFWKNLNDYYKSDYSYDANGNLQTLKRNSGRGTAGGGQFMDNLKYTYNLETNQLNKVIENLDGSTTSNGDYNDITGVHNYTYDTRGNLISDTGEGIQEIRWNALGKVAQAIPIFNPDADTDPNDDITQKPHVTFIYDETGNRIIKKVNSKPYNQAGVWIDSPLPTDISTTYYHRDASGNVMATYNRVNSIEEGQNIATFTLEEQPIYGSKRIGQRMNLTDNNLLASIPFDESEPYLEYDLGFDVQSEYNHHALILSNSAGTGYSRFFGISTEESSVGLASYSSTMNYLTSDQAVTVSEDRQGNVNFYITVQSVTGTQNNYLVLYNSDFVLKGASDFNLDIDLKCKPQIIQHPEYGNTYFVFFRTNAGELGYVTVNVFNNEAVYSEQPPQVIFGSDANIFSTNNVGRNMAAVESNYQAAPSTLFFTTYTQYNTTLHAVQFVNGIWEDQEITNSNISNLDKFGEGDLAISPDAKELSLYGLRNSVNVMGTTIQRAIVHQWSLDELLLPTSHSQFDIGYSTQDFCELEYDTSGSYLYASKSYPPNSAQTLEGRIIQIDLSNNGMSDVVINTSGAYFNGIDILGGFNRGKDGHIYVAINHGYARIENANTSNPILNNVPFNIGLYTNLTGGISNNPIRIWPPCPDCDEGTASRFYGQKTYEIIDHLGNVRATISDRKEVEFENESNTNYQILSNAELLSYSDYYPFGMMKSLGTYSGESDYRYGFNGMEKDDEIAGNGNSYTTMFRQYDPRIARWKSPDPKESRFSFINPYNSMLNNPIMNIDQNGDSTRYFHEGKLVGTTHDALENGVVHISSDECLKEFYEAYNNEMETHEDDPIKSNEQNVSDLKTRMNSDELATVLREFGTVYAIDGMKEFWSDNSDDATKNPRYMGLPNTYIVEHKTILYDENGVVRVGTENFRGGVKNMDEERGEPIENRTPNKPELAVSGLHTHGSAGLPAPNNNTFGHHPSSTDYGIAPMKNYFNVVVTGSYIYFYGHPEGNGSRFAINLNKTFTTNPPEDVWKD